LNIKNSLNAKKNAIGNRPTLRVSDTNVRSTGFVKTPKGDIDS
jgi:hypothetical protein